MVENKYILEKEGIEITFPSDRKLKFYDTKKKLIRVKTKSKAN